MGVRPMRPGEFVRFAWTQLTSMRTALVLLFALALAAIPGSLLPQRPTNPVLVSDFIRDNPVPGKWYDRLGLFDVFAAPWFAAVYLLLFISLVGCIIPRIAVHWRDLRTPPPHTPADLSKLPAYRWGTSELASGDVVAAAATHLKPRGYRVRITNGAVSAERGYLREFGNLIFHLSLVVLLTGLAWNSLYSYKGTAIVVEGQAFSNNLTQYDDFSAGAAVRAVDLVPFTVGLDDFEVAFETGSVQRGAARVFRAEVTTDSGPAVIEVNSPWGVSGTSVHLIGHGYAPLVAVTDAGGQGAFSGPVVFLPQDQNFTSGGVIKAPDARPRRLAFEGIFLPTAAGDGSSIASVFPDALNPVLYLNAWSGPPRLETGRPDNVYTLDTTGLSPVTDSSGQAVRFSLRPGDRFDLPGGGSISFDGWRRWTKLQISASPGLWLVLLGAVLAVLGLCASLFVRPRRLFVRADPGGITLAGLVKVEGRGSLDQDLANLAAAVGVSDPQRKPSDEQERR